MKYRSFTKDKLKISQLGFGLMRLPTEKNDHSKIKFKEAAEMLDYARKNGVNYYDVAWPYHEEQAEKFLGNYFEDRGGREEIHIATKSPVWLAKREGDFYLFLKEQLRRLKTDYIDFYLLHSLDKERWENSLKLKVFDDIERGKKEGMIQYLGFSFHDDFDTFKEIVDYYDWDFCQIQLNFMDTEHQAGLKGLEYAHNKGLDVVIMEPIKGGKLSYPPKDILSVWDKSQYDLSPSARALAYLWNREEVNVVLSGMSSLTHVKENIEVADKIEANMFSQEELDLYREVEELYDRRMQVGCTGCEYCMPCPNGVYIPDTFSHFNNLYVYEEEENKQLYKNQVKDGHGADQCIECGICETLCPQHLEIIDDLKRAHKTLTEE